jgi:hypothetical protein
MLRRNAALLRVIVCLLGLALSGLPQPVSGGGTASAAPTPLAWLHAQDKEEPSCGQGKATKEFGWKVVDFGISTLKYLIGLFIVPVGLFLVVIGALLELVETLAC